MDLKEKVKEYWNNRPCNIKHSDKELCTKEYFDEVEKKKYFVEPHIPKFAQFERWNGKKVLEIGCGIGTDSINFARHGADLTIVEFSDVSLEITKKRFDLYGLKATFYLGDVERLSEFLPTQHFDLIYSFGVLHHTPDQKKAFSEVAKFVDKDTELRIMVYSKISYKLFWLMQKYCITDMSKMDELMRNNSEAQYGCPVTYTYTFEEIKELLRESNLTIKSIEKDHIFTWNIVDYRCHEYVRSDEWKNVDEKQINVLAKELGWHTLIVAHSLKNGA